MKYLKTVYVFRYDEKTHTRKKSKLDRVLVSGTRENYSLSDTLNRDGYIVLRVLQNPDADILPGDVISLEDSPDDIPPDEVCGVVVSVKRNTLGSEKVQHTKIVCR